MSQSYLLGSSATMTGGCSMIQIDTMTETGSLRRSGELSTTFS